MSITTKNGDDGTTALRYNRRLSKCHPRIEACGTVDELSAALGLARATATHDFVRAPLLAIQQELVVLMGELATLPEDRERCLKDGQARITQEQTARLDELIRAIETQQGAFKGWAVPGATVPAAALDMARTTCRRAERRVCALADSGQLENPALLAYLNRLSDALWLLARWTESQSPPPPLTGNPGPHDLQD